MSRIKGAIVVDTSRCKGCGLCVGACPREVLGMAESQVNLGGYHYAVAKKADECTGCASCAIICPDACISVYRERTAATHREQLPHRERKKLTDN